MPNPTPHPEAAARLTPLERELLECLRGLVSSGELSLATGDDDQWAEIPPGQIEDGRKLVNKVERRIRRAESRAEKE